jgi:BASS family bile acid:Na+ symporter
MPIGSSHKSAQKPTNKNTHIMTLLLNISRCLARYTSLFVIVVAIVAFLAPESFAWVQEGQRASVILGLIMLTMGCTLSAQDFRILLSRPMDIFV